MRFEREVLEAHARALREVFGDGNTLHSDDAAARAAGFERPLAHGAILAGFLSEIVGVRLGDGLVLCDLRIAFAAPFHVGDRLAFELAVQHNSAALGATSYSFTVLRGETRVAHGTLLAKRGAPNATAAGAAG